MEILNYTEKSFVLFGEKSKEAKEQLKQLGGRFNPNLTHPETKDKLSAWVFSKKALEKVKEFLSSGVVPETAPKSSSRSKTSVISKDPVEDIIDPISRLGLKDNGPDPVKKTRKSTKLVPTKEITRVVVPCSLDPCSLDPCSANSPLSVKIELLSEEESITPEIIQIPSYSMILPKKGMKVFMKDKNEKETVFQIIETIKDLDGYVFEFIAVEPENPLDKLNFVWVGKQWKILSTLTPIWMNLVKS